MNETSFNKLIQNINDSLKLVPGIYKLSTKVFINELCDKKIKTQGIELLIDKDYNYIFNIYTILIKSTNILDVIYKAQKKLQYELSLVKYLMDKNFILNFYIEDIS